MIVMILLAVIGVNACVFIHYAAIQALLDRRAWLLGRLHRRAVLIVVFTLLAAHLVEISVYAALYLIAQRLGHGSLGGAYTTALDAFYFSAVTFTTVGFGDITPSAGGMRLLTAIEAINGIMLVGWSTSVTFLTMSRLFTAEEVKA